jgi:MFS family permease
MTEESAVPAIAFSTAMLLMATLALYALPAYASDLKSHFELTSTEVALLSSSFAFSYALVQIPGGLFGEAAGFKSAFAFSLGLVGVSFLASAFANSYGMLLVLRALCGIGAGMLFPIASSLARSAIPTENLRSQGVITSGWGIGYVFSLLALPLAFSSWRAGFVAVGVFSLGLAAYAAVGLPTPPRSGRATAFGEAKHGLAQRGTWLLGLCTFGLTLSNVGAGAWATSFVKDERGQGGATAALLPSLIGWGLVPATILGTLVARRIGEIALIRIASVVLTISIALIAIPAPLAVFGVGLWLLGLGTGLPMGVILALVAKAVFGPGGRAQATVVGAINATAFVGGVIAPAMVGLIRDETGRFALGFASLVLGPAVMLLAASQVAAVLRRGPPEEAPA